MEMRDKEPLDAEKRPERFTWSYWDLYVPWVDAEQVSRASFPLAIATVTAPLEEDQRHLFTIHSLFELLPQKMKASNAFNPANAAVWNYLNGLGVVNRDVVPSNHAWAWQLKKDPNAQPHASGLSFN